MKGKAKRIISASGGLRLLHRVSKCCTHVVIDTLLIPWFCFQNTKNYLFYFEDT